MMKEADELRQLIHKREIQRWDVSHISLLVTGVANFTPATVDRHFSHRMTLQNLVSERNEEVGRFLDAFQETEYVPSTKTSDIHWACAFTDRDGKKVFSLHLARLTEEGFINGKTVRFSGKLRPWFLEFSRQHFGEHFGLLLPKQ